MAPTYLFITSILEIFEYIRKVELYVPHSCERAKILISFDALLKKIYPFLQNEIQLINLEKIKLHLLQNSIKSFNIWNFIRKSFRKYSYFIFFIIRSIFIFIKNFFQSLFFKIKGAFGTENGECCGPKIADVVELRSSVSFLIGPLPLKGRSKSKDGVAQIESSKIFRVKSIEIHCIVYLQVRIFWQGARVPFAPSLPPYLRKIFPRSWIHTDLFIHRSWKEEIIKSKKKIDKIIITFEENKVRRGTCALFAVLIAIFQTCSKITFLSEKFLIL